MKTLLDEARDYVIGAKEQLANIRTSGIQGICQARRLTRQFSQAVTATTGFLRTALDRCAHELYDRCVSPKPPKKPDIYFPIAEPSITPGEFAARVDKKIPGLKAKRPDLVALLASFQAFSSPGQKWLADFATLCNENKHHKNDPSMAVTFTSVDIGGGFLFVGGRNLAIRDCMVNGRMINAVDLDRHGNVTKAQTDPGVRVEQRNHVNVRFDAVNEEVIPFLHRAISGVERIVEEVGKNI
jgi:hypothetical protein